MSTPEKIPLKQILIWKNQSVEFFFIAGKNIDCKYKYV